MVSRTQREHPRYAHEAAVTFHAGGASLLGRTDNVSRGGLCATIDGSIAVGSDVELDLQLVFDEHTQSEPLRLPARVVWCTPIRDAHQIGVAFKPLDADRADYLAMFLRFLDGDAPPERPKRPSSLDKQFG